MAAGLDTVAKAGLSQGLSAQAILERVSAGLDRRNAMRGTLVDLGCGTGDLHRLAGHRFAEYVGVDAVHYDGFPASATFLEADLNGICDLVADESADVVVSVETIEHLENPRAFIRMAARIVKPGGWLVVTTPNQLSLLSKLSLCCSNQFPAFKERPGLYPSHITAVLEIDLIRMATEAGFGELAVEYSEQGRLPGISWHWPRWLSRWFPRALSDNVLLFARKPELAGDERRSAWRDLG